MLSSDSRDTKTKILETAFELFGKYGFEGTSIRAISKKSGVNLAAINYHFKNKDNLFWEIMGRTYIDLENAIGGFANQSNDTVELAMKTFDYFQQEKYALKNTMKMMLAEGIQPPESKEIQDFLNNPMGPPGGQHFAASLQKNIDYQLSMEGTIWGVKAIFGSVFHWGVMLCSDNVCDKHSDDPMMAPEQIRKDVEHMVKASLMYLRASRDRFEAKS